MIQHMPEVAPWWNGIVLAIIALVASVVGAWQRRGMHDEIKDTKASVLNIQLSINGRLNELLESTRKAAHSQGIVEGMAQQESKAPSIVLQIDPKTLVPPQTIGGPLNT